ncbi:MAG: DUF309 domain-containing protein [Sulfolobaceae archaeon]
MRYLLFYSLNLSQNIFELKSVLRKKGINVIDIRKGKYIEIDIMGNPVDVINYLGNPLFIVKVGEIREDLRKLINEMRFWECHEILEEKWKKAKSEIERKYIQALILLFASLIKYLKNQIEVSDMLLEKSLSLISDLPEELLPLLFINLALNP